MPMCLNLVSLDREVLQININIKILCDTLSQTSSLHRVANKPDYLILALRFRGSEPNPSDM